jgi:hypothetical protein
MYWMAWYAGEAVQRGGEVDVSKPVDRSGFRKAGRLGAGGPTHHVA